MTSVLKSENIAHSRGLYTGLLATSIIIFFSLLIRILCMGTHDLLVEEAYYWNYSQHLDFGYLDHPPMVAFLIKVSTLIFGTNEFSIRFPALFCWGLAAFFSFKWTELIRPGSGPYALVLLSLMPFYFFQSVVTTPDQPVLVCWSAALYYFYRTFLFDDSHSWYNAGVWLGLGLLSKYTIVLLGPAVLLYMISVPSARYWFTRKEPYLCALIAIVFFTPVIYWNATHEWASFVFQSMRRFQSPKQFSFHYFIGLVLLFLLPAGVVGLFSLWNKKATRSANLDIRTQRFLQIFTLFPLAFFGVYSLSHQIKLDWIGPGLVSIIPWLAILISKSNKYYKAWHIGAVFLIALYTTIIGVITFGVSEDSAKGLFNKLISWENITEQFHDEAKKVALARNSTPILVPLDLYNVASELAFYQAKLLERGTIQQSYPVIGRHIFGKDSLMYRYWSAETELSGKIVMLISEHLRNFDTPEIRAQAVAQSSPKKIWALSQGTRVPITPYYYQLVQMK